MGSVNDRQGQSRCKECQELLEVNEYGYCKSCVEERTRRVKEGKSPPREISNQGEIQKEHGASPFWRGIDHHKDSLNSNEFQTVQEKKIETVSAGAGANTEPKEYITRRFGYCCNCNGWIGNAGYDGLCYDCSHCQTCKQQTVDLEGGLCKTNTYCVHLYSYRQDIVNVDCHQKGNSGTVVISFRKPIKATETTLEQTNLRSKKEKTGIFGFFRQPQSSELTSSFGVTTSSKGKIEILTNQVNIQITSKQGRHFTRTVSGGRYDFMGGTESGYYVSLNAQENDERIIPIATKILREMKFASLISNYSINGHLGDKAPTLAGEQERVKDFLERIASELVPKQPPSSPVGAHKIPEIQPREDNPLSNQADGKGTHAGIAQTVPTTTVHPQEVPKKVREAIIADLVEIRTKEVASMIRKGYAYNERQAMQKVPYDDYVPKLARSHDVNMQTVKWIIAEWLDQESRYY